MEKNTKGIREEIPMQSVLQTMERQLCPCPPWQFEVEQERAQSVMVPQGKPVLHGAPGTACSSLEGGPRAVTDLLAGLVTPVGTHDREIHSCRTAPCVEGAHAGAVHEELQLV